MKTALSCYITCSTTLSNRVSLVSRIVFAFGKIQSKGKYSGALWHIGSFSELKTNFHSKFKIFCEFLFDHLTFEDVSYELFYGITSSTNYSIVREKYSYTYFVMKNSSKKWTTIRNICDYKSLTSSEHFNFCGLFPALWSARMWLKNCELLLNALRIND